MAAVVLATKADLANEQDELVSGVNIKTINSQSLLGSGNIVISTDGSINIDDAPASGSANAVSSGGVYTALQGKANAIHNHAATDITQDTTHRFITDTERTTWSAKQTLLISGTNIKTINGTSLLGSGDITITGGGGSGTVDTTIINGSANAVAGNAVYDALVLKADLVAGLIPLGQLPTFTFSGFTGSGSSGDPYVLTKDTSPTSGSSNPITSGGVYTAIAAIGGGSTISTDFEITDYTKGVILRTSDGTKARITLKKDSSSNLYLEISDPL